LVKEPCFKCSLNLVVKRFPFLDEKRSDGSLWNGVECNRVFQSSVVSGHEVRNLDAFEPWQICKSGLCFFVLSSQRHVIQMTLKRI
jgi:hypothetical protein